MKILIVDDKEENLYFLEALLKGSGYEVVSAANGAEALEKLRAEGADMIVSDVLMPVMDGFKLCKEVRADNTLKDIPLVFYTATYKDKRDEELASKLGADRYIIKPMEPDELLKILQDVIKVAEKGRPVPEKPTIEEEEVFKLYSERLVSKLEKKMLELEESERKLRMVNRALEALSRCNQALIRAIEESDLLNEICRLIVDVGGYHLVWVGFAEQDKEKTVRPVAQVGYEEGYLDTIKITWSDTEHGRGPTGTAIRTAKTIINKDILKNPDCLPWRDEAIKRGYASSIALPLIADEQVLGALNIYATKPDAFDTEEVKLLTELADDLAFGIMALRTRDERKRAEEALRQRTHDLGERVKELGCLYGLSKLIEQPDISLEEIFQGIVQLIPPGWQYPDITCSRVVFEDKEFKTDNFKNTQWKQSADIMVSGKKAGVIEVCYLEERPELDEGPFLKEERDLINTLAERLGDFAVRKQAEETRERLETALEQAAEIVVITDPEGTIQYVNPAFEQITGYQREEAVGQNPRFLKSRKQDEAFYRDLWNTITQGQVWKGRFINKKEDGTFYHEEATISPVHDDSGKIINFVAVKRDITQQLELENQLRHAQKMESIGQLAGGVAHDFNNILTSIMGFSSLLKRDKDLSEKTRKRILEIEKASHRAAEIVKQLLTFSRKKPPELKTMNLSDLVKQSLGFLGKSLGPAFKIESRLDESLGMIQGDGTQVQQVLMNLCVNARDAMPDGGTIIIETCNIEIRKDYVAQYSYAKPGPKVVLSITDTGTGMDKETLSRIFDPFFTTKEIGKGTGLGMSIVYGIVKDHGGTIQVYSEVGHGTTVKIYFPRVIGDLEIEEKIEAEVRGGKETILIVDDDELVLNLASSVLEDYGYKYLTATGGPEALDIFRQKYQSIDLVLLDFVMPGMSGKEVFEGMLKIDPSVAVIMSSGFSVEDENVFLDRGVKAFVSKPYDEERLARVIREILDERINRGAS